MKYNNKVYLFTYFLMMFVKWLYGGEIYEKPEKEAL